MEGTTENVSNPPFGCGSDTVALGTADRRVASKMFLSRSKSTIKARCDVGRARGGCPEPERILAADTSVHQVSSASATSTVRACKAQTLRSTSRLPKLFRTPAGGLADQSGP